MDAELIDLLRRVKHGDIRLIDRRIEELEREIAFLRELKPLLLKRVAATLPDDPLKGKRPKKPNAQATFNKDRIADQVFEHLFKNGPQFVRGIAGHLGLPDTWVSRAVLDNEWFSQDAEGRLCIARERNNV